VAIITPLDFSNNIPRYIAATVARAMDRDRMLAVNVRSLDEYFERLNECITHNTPTLTIYRTLTRKAL